MDLIQSDAEMINFNWDSHSRHVRQLMKDMRSSDSFKDVTILCDDQKHIRAHRNILAGFSPVFKEIFRSNEYYGGGTNPTVFLRGIEHDDLLAIVKYIYEGEVVIHQDRVGQFLSASKSLGIQELSQRNEVDNNFEKSEELNELSNRKEVDDVETVDVKKALKRGRPYKIKEENFASAEQSGNGNQFFQEEELNNDVDIKDEEGKIYSYNTRGMASSRVLTCNECLYESSKVSHMKRHIYSVHLGLRINCQLCDYQALNKEKLKGHIQKKHLEGTLMLE